MKYVPLTTQDSDQCAGICATIPGYSGRSHYTFFKSCLLTFDIKSLLMCGVYFGRDIAMIQAIARNYDKPVAITGVDKFSDTPCADWTEAQRAGGTWDKAGFGMAPTLGAARANTSGAVLVESDDEQWLTANALIKFDMVYLDTSHDFATVSRQLRQIKPLLAEHGVASGDDYADQGTWGVKSAVTQGTVKHSVFENAIWWTIAENLR